MKITGGSSYIRFDLENGYVIKGEGEMLVGGKFIVYKSSMTKWEPPHEKEIVTDNDIQNIILQVEKDTNENTIQISFE